jgi:hypothetical protein
MLMADVTCQQCPEGRATQSRLGSASANRSPFRCCPTTGPGLLPFTASSLPLPRAGSATEGASPSHRNQVGVYRQTSTQPDSAGSSVRCHQTIVHQRGGQPGIARTAATRARAWVSRDPIGHGPVVWNIDSIAGCRKNWCKSISCWCPRSGGQWEARKGLWYRPSPVRR